MHKMSLTRRTRPTIKTRRTPERSDRKHVALLGNDTKGRDDLNGKDGYNEEDAEHNDQDHLDDFDGSEIPEDDERFAVEEDRS